MKQTHTDTTSDANNKYELLRKLLLDEQISDVEILKYELLNKERFQSKVNPVIDEKIEDLRKNFPEYFGTTITQTIKQQIKDSQDEVVEALYPIMGKMVKKFIVAEVTKLSDNINKTIKEKFSIKQIFLRLLKGKKNDADVIINEVFTPIIEEIFVIKKDSGLLCGNYSRGNIADKDMISGMLTAIKAFAEDAFSKENQNLEDIKFDNFQLSIQNFKTIYIAIATSGVITSEFKEQLFENCSTLAEKVLRDRTLLADQIKLNALIKEIVIEENN